MKCMDCLGNVTEDTRGEHRILENLYRTRAGRELLKILVSPKVSTLAGKFCDSRFSKCLIGPVILKNRVNLSLYKKHRYVSYNDFFTRELKEEERIIDAAWDHLVSPSDGFVQAFSIDGDSVFIIKQARYRLPALFRSESLAKRYQGGTAVVIRLAPGDYHRYCYPADGAKSRNFHIPGVYHILDPKVGGKIPVYQENTREFSILKTQHFGRVLQMEVGALLIGRINNFHSIKQVRKGEEKGCFDFGGSTIVLFLEKGVPVCSRFLENTRKGMETRVNMGEWLASPKE